MIQGAGGAIFPPAFGIIRDEFPRERIASGIALVSAILGVGAGLGIVLAGPIVDAPSYHWLFWFPLILVVIAAVMAVLFVPESPIKIPGRINWIGAALLSGWLLCVLVGISEGPTWGSAILGVGIGLAFASLANLIVEAVAPEQTAVATGVNTVMRSLGGSVGSQIGASVITATVVGSALPTEHGFTVAFIIAATACGPVGQPRRSAPDDPPPACRGGELATDTA